MKRTLSKLLLAVCGLLGSLCPAMASPQDLIPIYVEGALENPPYHSENTPESTGLSETEQALVKGEILCAACRKTRDEDLTLPCPESELSACGVLDTLPAGRNPRFARGSFTRPNSNQKAILYSYDGGWNVVAVFEADHVVAHVLYWAYAGTHGDRGPLALPDIDGSGRSPLLIMSGGTHQGETVGGVSIIGLTEKGLRNFGDTQTLDDPCLYHFGKDEDQKREATAYKLFARKGATPVFYRQAFTGSCRAGAEPTHWVKSGRLEQITLEGAGKTDRYVRLK